MNSCGSHGDNDPTDSCLTQSTTSSIVDALITAGKDFHSRNWVLGTTGSFSALVCRDPFQFLITQNGVHKGALTQADFVPLDQLDPPNKSGRLAPPEAPLHRTIILERDVQAVLHTHSVWSTMLSDLYADAGGLTMEGFEMLKGLSHVKTHQHEEWLPILENSEDYASLSRIVADVLSASRGIHGILLRKCGLYTWGRSVAEAVRHVELFEFLFEVLGRRLHILSQLDLSSSGGNQV